MFSDSLNFVGKFSVEEPNCLQNERCLAMLLSTLLSTALLIYYFKRLIIKGSIHLLSL